MKGRYWLAMLAVAMCFSINTQLDAIEASGNLELPATVVTLTPDQTTYRWPDAGSVNVAYNPSAGPILKVLEGSFEGVIQQGGSAGLITLIEEITVDGTFAFTDWHEKLTVLSADSSEDPAPGWSFFDITVDGLNEEDYTLQLSDNQKEAWLFFDPAIAPGTTFTLTKSILGGINFQEDVAVLQYPTVPEPTTYALLGSCMMVVALIGRRRRATA